MEDVKRCIKIKKVNYLILNVQTKRGKLFKEDNLK